MRMNEILLLKTRDVTFILKARYDILFWKTVLSLPGSVTFDPAILKTERLHCIKLTNCTITFTRVVDAKNRVVTLLESDAGCGCLYSIFVSFTTAQTNRICCINLRANQLSDLGDSRAFPIMHWVTHVVALHYHKIHFNRLQPVRHLTTPITRNLDSKQCFLDFINHL